MDPPCPGSGKHGGSPWQLVADSASQRQGSSMSLDTSSLMGGLHALQPCLTGAVRTHADYQAGAVQAAMNCFSTSRLPL